MIKKLLTLGILALSILLVPIKTQAPTQQQVQSEAERIIQKLIQAETHEVLIFDEGIAGGICTGAVLENSTRVVVLTARHCIGPQPELYVEGVPVIDYTESKKYDLALLFLEYNVPDKNPSIIADNNVRKGDELYGIGYSKIEGFPLYGTHFFSIRNNAYAKMEVQSGCSGAGLYNDDGELVGTVWGHNGMGLGLYTPISFIKKFFNEVGYVQE